MVIGEVRVNAQRPGGALPTDFTTPAAVQNDDSYTLDNTGAYVQAIIRPAASLEIIPGFRMDKFRGDLLNNADGLRARLQDYDWIRQPKLGMVYSPAPGLSLYANWGRTFQILTGSGAPAYLVPGQARFAPSINTGKEVGIKFTPAPGADLRIAAWQQDATGEVANMPATGTTVGLGETRRKGLDLQVSGRIGERIDLTFSHSLQKAEVVSAFTADGSSLAGKEASYYIDNANALGKFGGFALFDASVRHQLSRNVSLDLQVKNLADRGHAYAWYDNFFWPAAQAQPMFSAGTGRAAYQSLNVKL